MAPSSPVCSGSSSFPSVCAFALISSHCLIFFRIVRACFSRATTGSAEAEAEAAAWALESVRDRAKIMCWVTRKYMSIAIKSRIRERERTSSWLDVLAAILADVVFGRSTAFACLLNRQRSSTQDQIDKSTPCPILFPSSPSHDHRRPRISSPLPCPAALLSASRSSSALSTCPCSCPPLTPQSLHTSHQGGDCPVQPFHSTGLVIIMIQVHGFPFDSTWFDGPLLFPSFSLLPGHFGTSIAHCFPLETYLGTSSCGMYPGRLRMSLRYVPSGRREPLMMVSSWELLGSDKSIGAELERGGEKCEALAGERSATGSAMRCDAMRCDAAQCNLMSCHISQCHAKSLHDFHSTLTPTA